MRTLLKLTGLMVLLVLPLRAEALEPDELLLVVNKNAPVGRRLAEFYQNARQVPEGRIVELDLPGGEDIPFALYERNVVQPLREHLRTAALDEKVKCIVTFHGVPLRIGPRLVTDADKQEIAALQQQKQQGLAQVLERVSALEARLRKADPAFQPGEGEDLRQLLARAEGAMKPFVQAIAAADEADRPALMAELVEATRFLAGPAGVLRNLSADAIAAANPAAREQAEQLVRGVQQIAAQIAQLQQRRNDPDARTQVRALVAGAFGMLEHLRIIDAHLEYLDGAESTASFDSELALLWWNLYPRARWQGNPLHYQIPAAPNSQPVLMVARLDAPQAGQVRDMIIASMRAERDGLKGRVVIDSRGMDVSRPEQLKTGGYEWYDRTLVDLAELIRTRTTLPLLHDVSPTVLPGGAADDVALYCGWYSVRNYVPACRFNLGAVAFHVASFELVSLRNPEEKGWVRGLLNDGAAASMGPVAEPYLMAFPRADDFFPLLLTGRLTLAEAYWRTQPTVSWMMSLIGDPLYRPYAKTPALRVEDLPERLRKVVE